MIKGLCIAAAFAALLAAAPAFAAPQAAAGREVAGAPRAPVSASAGASIPHSLTQPATWALMILGLGGVGALLRDQGQQLRTPD